MLTLLFACALSLKEAVWPANPPRLRDMQRLACVYAAEALLAAAFVHLWLTEPQLFGGLFDGPTWRPWRV